MNSRPSSKGSPSEKEAFLGLLFQQHGEWAEAKDHWLQALSLNRKRNNDLATAQALCNLGFILEKLGELEKAQEYLQAALQTYRQLNDLGGQAITLNNFGLLYRGHGNMKAALDYFEQAHMLFQSWRKSKRCSCCFGKHRWLLPTSKVILIQQNHIIDRH